MVGNKTDGGYKLNVNGTSKVPSLKINSKTPFYLRVWYSLINPITYLLNGTRRW